jgi:hypothetical protein
MGNGASARGSAVAKKMPGGSGLLILCCHNTANNWYPMPIIAQTSLLFGRFLAFAIILLGFLRVDHNINFSRAN